MDHPKRGPASSPNAGWTRRAWLKLTAAAWVGQPLRRAFAQTRQNPPVGGAGAPMFQNPLLAGDYADPTILRRGRGFYMTHTSYAYSPGLVVWHSRDLVNWSPIGHAVSVPHGEIWAPDLVEHEGRYFIYFPMGGVFVVHADHPAGPWSEPVALKINDIDPGHVVGPDGKRYLYTAGGHVVELSADGLSTVGPRQKVL